MKIGRIAAVLGLVTLAACAPSSPAGSSSTSTPSAPATSATSDAGTSSAGGQDSGSASASSGSTASSGTTESATTSADSGAPVTLKVWGWRQEDASVYNDMFAEFTKSHPNIKAEYVGYQGTEYDAILSTGLSAADGPDVAQLRSYGLLQPLAKAGNLVDLDGKVDDLKKFPDAVLDGARETTSGKVYGVPFAIQTLHIIYNKKLFADNGLSVPKTWDEFVKLCDTLEQNKITPIAATVADTWMLPIEHEIFGSSRYGGEQFKADLLAGKKKFTDAAWVDSVSDWAATSKYWGENWQGTKYADAQTLFSSGAAAMFPGGIWEIAGFQKADPDLQLGIFSIPPMTGSAGSQALTPGFVDGSFGVASKSQHQEAALELVKWMATPEFGQLFSDKLTQISPVPGVTPKDPILSQAVADYTANPSSYLSYAYFSGGTPDGWTLEQKALSDAVLGKASAAEAAAAMQKGIDQWFKPQS